MAVCEIRGGWFQAGRTARAKPLMWEQGGLLQEEQRDWEEGAQWRKKVVGSDGSEEEEPNPVASEAALRTSAFIPNVLRSQ